MSIAFAPASVANVAVGFDILGHSMDAIGDTVRVERISAPGVHIREIQGLPQALPMRAEENTAGRALLALLEARGLSGGFEVWIQKGIPLGSGLGGSAASCVAALVAANALLDAPLSRDALYPFALAGEAVASGSAHGDNVAPMLLGGVVLATLDRMIPLAVPEALHCVVVHPDQVLETRRARAALAEPYPIAQFVAQSTHLALFLTGLQRGDLALLREGLRDVLVEPRRAPLIPGFVAVQAAALAHDALGASISGAGPSVFAWFASKAQAEAAAPAMRAAFADAGYDARAHVSPVAGPRADVVAEDAA